MDLRRRMELLADAALADREGVPGIHRPSPVGKHPLASVGIAAVRVPGRGCVNLMRVMQTNACSLSCGYCPTFRGGNVPRVAISPEETARTFMDVHRKGLASGLFLTSGVPGRAPRATDRMLATLELLRRREGFAGYVHIKLLPGAERAQVEEAARLANRISVNLEAPTDAHVHRLTIDKNFSGDLLPKLELAGRLLAARRNVPNALPSSGATTQFVVGAAGERDREILGVVDRLERRRLLHHAHFSAFQPVAGTPLEHLPATPAARELRLYRPSTCSGSTASPCTSSPSVPTAISTSSAIPRRRGRGRTRRSFRSRSRARRMRPWCVCPALGPPRRARWCKDDARPRCEDARICAGRASISSGPAITSCCAAASSRQRRPPSSCDCSRRAVTSHRRPIGRRCRRARIAEESTV